YAFFAWLLVADATVTVLRFSRNVSFIQLHDAAKLVKRVCGFGHRFPDAVRHIPSGAIGTDSQLLFQLVRADAFLRVYGDGKSHEPFVQRKVRVVEDRSRGRRELRFASLL